ncbi:MAG: recombinase family protein, partial [Clostridia bacterium]|nr:recombinase family protein [Clostridia bacterium]
IFEKEGIHTLDAVSETFLTWFSAFAQAESESLSQNVTRGKRMGYKEGKFALPPFLYGYDRGDGITPVIIPEQATIIRKMFHMYLEGESIRGIKNWLEENEIETPRGTKVWSGSTVAGILKNEKYKGDVLLQKSYTVDYLTKTMARNKGEVAQYYIENNHEGIVSREIFNMVQDEIQRRASLYSSKTPSKYSSKYALTGKVICGECGAKYRRVTWSRDGKKKIVWRCIERLTNGTKNCKNSPTIFEEDLHNAILESLKQMMPKSDDIAKKVRNEIEISLRKNDANNPKVIRRKIRSLEKETEILRNILRETEDKEFYAEKIKRVQQDIEVISDKLIKTELITMNTEFDLGKSIIHKTELVMNNYIDIVVRNIVNRVIIDKNGIKTVLL